MASTKMKVSQELPRTTKVNSAMFPVLIFHLRLNNLVSKVDATFDSPESNSVSVFLKFKSSLWKRKPKFFLGVWDQKIFQREFEKSPEGKSIHAVASLTLVLFSWKASQYPQFSLRQKYKGNSPVTGVQFKVRPEKIGF